MAKFGNVLSEKLPEVLGLSLVKKIPIINILINISCQSHPFKKNGSDDTTHTYYRNYF